MPVPSMAVSFLNSPIPFRRAYGHEFHTASPLFLPRDLRVSPVGEEAIRLGVATRSCWRLKRCNRLATTLDQPVPVPGYRVRRQARPAGQG